MSRRDPSKSEPKPKRLVSAQELLKGVLNRTGYDANQYALFELWDRLLGPEADKARAVARAKALAAAAKAKAMGLHVAAVDIADDKLKLAEELGADLTVNAATTDPVATVQREAGGAHGVLVTAVSPKAFGQAIGMVRRKGTVALVGLPPGDFPAPIFDIVLKRITVRGSIVGTRMDLAEALAFAGEGKVASHFSWARLEEINQVFDRMRQGKIDGRVVLDLR